MVEKTTKFIQFRESRLLPASEAAIAAAYTWRDTAANHMHEMHRQANIRSDGRIAKSFQWVCVATNAPWNATHGDLSAYIYQGGSYLAVMENKTVLGRAPYRHIAGFNYPDGECAARKYLRFLVDPEVSPWRSILHSLVHKDPDKIYEDRMFLFQQLDNVPYKVLQSFMIAARLPYEVPNKAAVFADLVDQGVPGNIAYILGSHFTKKTTVYDYAGSGGHEACDMIEKTVSGFMTGLYAGTTPAFSTDGKEFEASETTQYYADGFGHYRTSPVGSYSWDKKCCTSDPIGYELCDKFFRAGSYTLDYLLRAAAFLSGQEVETPVIIAEKSKPIEVKKARPKGKMIDFDLDLGEAA